MNRCACGSCVSGLNGPKLCLGDMPITNSILHLPLPGALLSFSMLIATQSRNVESTSQYFDQVLTQGDYYLGQEINGRWQGQGADLLGVKQGTDVTKEQFDALLRGKHPVTGEPLTQRTRKDHRPGMVLTFSVPKSVSLAWAINGDERLLEALRNVVAETMTKDVEPLMQRRV